MRGWKWVILWSVWAARLVRQPTAPLRVSGGLLRGAVAHDGSHNQYLAIPYATLDYSHRFQGPGPEPSWDGIFEAVNENVRCKQILWNNIVFGQEDCLVVNIYVPINPAPDTLLPVMIFIHGGGFFEGSSSQFLYGPHYLVSKRTIVVTFNYRLNVEGFLCLGVKEAPGNAGMKDQVAALKWVKRNIRVFGGDPDNVTIFGESAGGASVSYHILSPMSKGLFNKAILQSGSALAAWSHQFEPVHFARSLAKVLGYDEQDPHNLVHIFKNKTAEELITAKVPRKEGTLSISKLLYVPCTEKDIVGVESFLSDTPYNILLTGKYNKVPMIIGSNNEEGYFFAYMETDKTLSDLDIEKALPHNLEFPSSDERRIVAKKLRKIYMGNNQISRKTVVQVSRLHGEPFFNYPSLEETELILRTNDKPVYNYFFNYSGWRNIVKFSLGLPFAFAPGASHADDLFYLFHQSLGLSIFETRMIDRMTTMWTNFAKYGQPTPEVNDLLPVKWLPTNQSSPSALVIDAELSTSPLWYSDSLKYWRQLYKRFRK